ncbi:MAG: hypothetical protein QOF69_423 [Solirubrobacteraceae bacterium]|nr:hypothetical protein [Solirubrobacteraceae bacterium]
MSATTHAISLFGGEVARRFATGGGEPEELLRGPFEQLVTDFAKEVGVSKVVLAGEHHLTADRVRPDYAVYASAGSVGLSN